MGSSCNYCFCKKIRLGPSKDNQYIEALDNFPRPEIEAELLNGSLTITGLDDLSKWLKLLNDNKPNLIEDMEGDLIRKIMLAKMDNGKVSRDDLRAIRYIYLSS
ncbi:hypothetical protein SFC65_20340 [Priestia filamentosa]|uniref:hypothetical protein n=1 Tax=Priestia filamentosa TaxID=1402861 RepID=UPI003982490B